MGVALPFYSGDNLSSSKIPIFDTTPFKDAPSADESVAFNNERRYYNRLLLQSKIQFTKSEKKPSRTGEI
jgi:hypothetical protein